MSEGAGLSELEEELQLEEEIKLMYEQDSLLKKSATSKSKGFQERQTG